ncbi:MAG: S49 family peptidase [Lautropia sp.]
MERYDDPTGDRPAMGATPAQPGSTAPPGGTAGVGRHDGGGERGASATTSAREGQSGGSAAGATWERRLLEELARDALVERRRARRWRIAGRLATLCVAAAVAAFAFGWFDTGAGGGTATRHTAVIELNGVIQSGGEIEADTVVNALQAAFKDRQTAGILLRLNSPGGSPVQAGIIHDEIKRLRKLNPSIPLYAVVEEMCASGGYYIAAAADRIFVDKASIVGSIGVLMDGFGFTGLMDKVGVERRLLTAGANKGFLDSFSPQSPEQVAHAKALLEQIHRQFIAVVREGRGARLKDDPEIFSGLFWTGERSIELGLADEFGSIDSVARDVIKAEELVDFTRRDSLLERVARKVGASVGQSIALHLRGAGEWRIR